ncbi:hypothetical protein GGX14DRAFT_694045 [Mycena pura]|uniref:Uncharacterized protein n=1 Tax=Mycena pura TaxID=153505 RepID=A0AAD7E2N4_9AGAR|nr:hypothetical protein GGX14DRAFT_694045 [Mycena pura]
MFRLLALSVLALASTLAATALPGFQSPASAVSPCGDAATVVISNTTIQVGAEQVHMSSFSCAGVTGSTTVTPHPSLAARTTRNVCGEPCTIVSCIDEGLPVPQDSDCAIIADAIGILGSQVLGPGGTTYELNAANGFFKQLVFGTCMTDIGVSAEEDTEACWSDWASIITQLIAACPGMPIGGCTSVPPGLTFADWSMEIRHS